MNNNNTEKINIEQTPKKETKYDSNGLSSSQVDARIHRGLTNEKVDSNTLTTREIIRSNVFTYFNFIFAVLATLLILVGSFKNLTFLPVIIGNTLIGIIQEMRSKKVLDNLNMLNAPRTTVIRNGSRDTIDSEQLVQDDLIVLEAGNQIPADAVIVSGLVSVNESLLTGEADEIAKTEGDNLMSGSFVVSGSCTAVLTKVGKDSYISQLTLEATKSDRSEQSEMIRSLDRLVKGVGILIIPIGVIYLVEQCLVKGNNLQAGVTGMVAAVIGMIPEGLYLLASVALVVSTMRLAKQEVLLHDMKCIETLARVDVLCVDKTGTITVPDMEVSGLRLMEADNKDECFQMLCAFSSSMSTDNATMKAMKQYFDSNNVVVADRIYPFSSEHKYSAASFGSSNYILGAPEFVLQDDYDKYADDIREYTSKGYRVVVFGVYNKDIPGGALSEPIYPLCFVYLSNAIRNGATNTFEYFAKCGVDIKVISGDNPQTVSEISMKAGISNSDKYIDASTLKDYSDIFNAVDTYTVFGRVTPEQKRMFVKALKAKGHTVAMTGDGVNDVLALKDADCSVAMASGSEAASSVSQIVLLDSDFSRMPSVVLEGRRVVNNIERSASLFLVKNIFSLLMVMLSMIFMKSYPIEPTQLSLISAFTIGIPGFFLAMESNNKRIKGHFLTNVFLKALPAGLTNFLIVGGFVSFCDAFGIKSNSISTAATIILAIVGFMILGKIASPMTKMHTILIVSLIVGCLVCMIALNDLFSMNKLTYQTGMLFVIFAICTEPVFRYLYIACTKLQEKLSSRHR